jgi:hypothetical protein
MSPKKNEVVTLQQVHDIITKHLYLPQTERIDIILATVLSLFYEGNPLWLFIIGRSGDAKTEIVRALEGLPFIRKIDQLTANTFASGRKDVDDLGKQLQNKKTILLFSDLACLISLNKDEKKKIWSQFRTLYDGDIYKDTGSGANRKYRNCHVTIIACVTRVIKEEHHVHQQLGTRELLYDTNADFADNKKKMQRVFKNIGNRKTIRQEIQDVVHQFIKTHRFDNTITIPDDIIEYIYDQCQKLTLLRATAPVDWYSGELSGDADTEVPTRLSEQFMVLYKGLHSLDTHYDDSRYKNIIENIVRSSSHPVRYKLYTLFKQHQDHYRWFKLTDLMELTKLGRKAIISQCEILWNLNVLEKQVNEEIIGEIPYTDSQGIERTKGGRMQIIWYYRMAANNGGGSR